MKLSELKHNHSLTDLLKILLFAIIMLAPIGMVATRCLYVIANKNAYQSYSGEENEYIETPLTNAIQLVLNQIYHFDSSGTYDNSSNTGNIKISDVSDINTSNTSVPTRLQSATYIRFYYTTTTKELYFYDENLSGIGSNNITNTTLQFNFRMLSYETNLTNNFSMLSKLDIEDQSHLDNVFEYSVSQLEESNLFNWTENTAIFSGIQTMTTQLGITNQTIPILLTYWFLLTVIYVIIDIILKLFTYMTHALGNRKA